MKPIKIGIFDYSAGNLGSLKSALNRMGFNDVTVTSDFSVLNNVHCIILPGVGSFGYCMKILNEKQDASSFFKKFLEQKDKMLIGICIGMQLLGNTSEESKGSSGLGLIPCSVEKIKVNIDQRLPHVGWNSIDSFPNNLKLSEDALDVYFDHSYKLVCDTELVLSKTFYGEEIPAIIRNKNIIGIQFHPELSGRIGSNILKHTIQGELNC